MTHATGDEPRLTDVALDREGQRRRRLVRLAVVLLVVNAWLVVRAVQGRPALPTFHVDPLVLVPVLFFVALIGVMVGTTMGAGRSPHTVVRPEQVDVRLAEVYAYRGMREQAFGALAGVAEAIELNDGAMASQLWSWQVEMRVSPFLRPLHDDPRWQQLMVEPLAVKT